MASLESRTPDHTLVFVAQAALRLGVRQKDFLPEVRKVVRGSDAEMRLLMAEAVGRLGVAAAPLQTMSRFWRLTSVNAYPYDATQQKASAASRAAAPRWISTLVALMESANWQVVHGAVEGLHALGEFPVSVIQRLELLLPDHEEPMRGTAAYGLMLAGPKAERAVSAIVGRLGHEESIGVCDNLSAALAHIGAAAVLPAVEVLRTGNMRTYPFAFGALLNMDDELLPLVTRILLSDRDAFVRSFGIELIRHLGSRTANVIPTLAEMLDAAEDGPSAEHLIMAIAECGLFMRDGATSLIRRLSTKSDRMAELACRALMQGGKGLLPLLAESFQDATGVARERIAHIMAAAMSPEKAFTRLKAIDRIKLETFSIVGNILCGGPRGSRELELLFREQLEATGRSNTKLMAKGRMLLLRIKKLEEALGCVLVGRGKNSKGGLTDEGFAWLWLIKEFLK